VSRCGFSALENHITAAFFKFMDESSLFPQGREELIYYADVKDSSYQRNRDVRISINYERWNFIKINT
jgi:hypothetical protein